MVVGRGRGKRTFRVVVEGGGIGGGVCQMEEDALNPRAVDGSQTPIVGHVVVVGFHAKLGSRIEFSYPKLRGSVELRTPRLNDTQDVASDDGVTEDRSQKYVSSGDWGCLPQAWSFLPLMALPDGAHDSEDDTAYFCLPPHVHCVACFRQTNASVAVNFNAGGQDADDSVAARGSVQKSVVLLCKRPIYGVLGDRLSGVVRAYFDQGDFSRTDVLAKLYHSINNSLSRPSLNDLQILVHGLDLRALVRSLRADTLKIIKLILLEKRIVFISQPVRYACNAVASIASVFPAAFDRMSPSMKPLDNSVENEAYGLPLELLAEGDRMTFQPYAPLPSINEILKDNLQGCLIGTSRNCGFLLKTAMSGDTKQNVPRVDAVVDIHTGQLTMRKELEAACAITRSEHVFITDLILAANQSVESSGALEYICSDDYIRVRLREYLRRFLGSAAALEGVLQPGEIDPKAEPPPIMDMATAERMDWSPVKNYNEVFGRQWVLWTRNCRAWARKCKPEVAQVSAKST